MLCWRVWIYYFMPYKSYDLIFMVSSLDSHATTDPCAISSLSSEWVCAVQNVLCQIFLPGEISAPVEKKAIKSVSVMTCSIVTKMLSLKFRSSTAYFLENIQTWPRPQHRGWSPFTPASGTNWRGGGVNQCLLVPVTDLTVNWLKSSGPYCILTSGWTRYSFIQMLLILYTG